VSTTEDQHWRKPLDTVNQYSAPRVKKLEQEFARMRIDYLQLKLRASALISERSKVREDLKTAQQQIIDIDVQREAAEHQVRQFKCALAEETSPPGTNAEARVRELERKLEEQRKGYESELSTLRETLFRVRKEQQNLPGTDSGRAVLTPDTRPPHSGRQRRQTNWVMMAAGFPLLLGVLASAAAFWDEKANTPERLHLMTPLTESDTADAASTEASQPDMKNKGNVAQQVALLQKPKTVKSRKYRNKKIVHGHWGPPLFMEDKQTTRKAGKVTFDPLVEQQQRDLLDMGFDLGQASADGLKGSRTRQALNEFRSLYLPQGNLQDESPGDDQLAVIMSNYAALARTDEEKFNVDRGVLAAIRLGSVRTGVDFSYLMELAAAESNFKPASKAVGSSATGLYQFTRETWLRTVKKHGDRYGLGVYTSQIEFYVDRAGRRRPMVRNPDVFEHLLDLRNNPRVSAMMAAESVKENLDKLMFSFDREPGRTELYLAHFLGVDGAISFLNLLDNNPDKMAGDVFPSAAQSNQSIFHSEPCRPRTVNEVYQIFDSKFNTSRYEDFNPGG